MEWMQLQLHSCNLANHEQTLQLKHCQHSSCQESSVVQATPTKQRYRLLDKELSDIKVSLAIPALPAGLPPGECRA